MLTLVEKPTWQFELPTFGDFWKIYPRKCGRKDAENAFRRIRWTPELWITVHNAIWDQRESEQWQAECGKFIPYPATWLRGERWTDELPGKLKVDPCGWPGCRDRGTAERGTRKYCARHEAALTRGETPGGR